MGLHMPLSFFLLLVGENLSSDTHILALIKYSFSHSITCRMKSPVQWWMLSSSQSHCHVSLKFKLNSTLNYLIIHATDVCFFLSAASQRHRSAGLDTQVLSRNLTHTSVLFSGTISAMQGQSGLVVPLTQARLQETVILDNRRVTLRPWATWLFFWLWWEVTS